MIIDEPPDKLDWITWLVWGTIAILLILMIFICLARKIEKGREYEPEYRNFYDIHLAQWQREPFPIDRVLATITAYNPTVEQCDSTPFITASGERVRVGLAANNCLEFGTLIRIDDRIYKIEDRMNKRYGCEYFDLFMWGYEEAIEHGKQIKEIEILSW